MSTDNFKWTDELVKLNRLRILARNNRYKQKSEYWAEAEKKIIVEIEKVQKGKLNWVSVECLDNLYEVTKCGMVFSRVKNKIIKGVIDPDGYRIVSILEKGKMVKRRVHRLVAVTFIPNPYNKPQVNHKDFNRLNNHVDNLEWATSKEDAEHKVAANRQHKTGRRFKAKTIN
jgi:hypothetical protein